ncbi:hypothetical protein G039_0319170 [Pseudomonas aeruginosa VRFPA01]|nr:hypothetical protein G039_0319170 [Pseudomonas aeruginosa VRFPA01]
MNGDCPRGLARWQARASSSLPVPVSPRISTLAEVSPTLAISSRSAWIAGERPMIRCARSCLPANWRRNALTSRASPRCSRARRATSTRRSGEKGFSMKS